MYFLKLNDNNFEFNTQNKCTMSDIAIQVEKDIDREPKNVYKNLDSCKGTDGSVTHPGLVAAIVPDMAP